MVLGDRRAWIVRASSPTAVEGVAVVAGAAFSSLLVPGRREPDTVAESPGGNPPKSWIVAGGSSSVVNAPSASQCADTARIAAGGGTSGARPRNATRLVVLDRVHRRPVADEKHGEARQSVPARRGADGVRRGLVAPARGGEARDRTRPWRISDDERERVDLLREVAEPHVPKEDLHGVALQLLSRRGEPREAAEHAGGSVLEGELREGAVRLSMTRGARSSRER